MNDSSDLLKGLLAGALGGVAGTVAMRLYWQAATALAGEDPRTLTSEDAPHALDEMSVTGGQHTQEDESSTAAVGRIAYEAVTDEEPDDETIETLSQSVHWAFGLGTSALYGAVRGPVGPLDAEGGLVFGTAVWALGDELMVPLLGLSKGPTAYPLTQHAHRFGAHLAFGLATAAATQALLGLARPHTTRRFAWKTAKTYLKWKAVKAGAKVAGRALAKMQG